MGWVKSLYRRREDKQRKMSRGGEEGPDLSIQTLQDVF
jgi:hypothetical protein